MKKIKGRNGGTLNLLEKGESGNPKGRPVNPISLLLKSGLSESMEVTVTGIDVDTGETRTIRIKNPTGEVIKNQILRQAAKGNMKAVEIVLDRTEGKTPLILSNPDGTGLNTAMPSITFHVQHKAESTIQKSTAKDKPKK